MTLKISRSGVNFIRGLGFLIHNGYRYNKSKTPILKSDTFKTLQMSLFNQSGPIFFYHLKIKLVQVCIFAHFLKPPPGVFVKLF